MIHWLWRANYTYHFNFLLNYWFFPSSCGFFDAALFEILFQSSSSVNGTSSIFNDQRESNLLLQIELFLWGAVSPILNLWKEDKKISSFNWFGIIIQMSQKNIGHNNSHMSIRAMMRGRWIFAQHSKIKKSIADQLRAEIDELIKKQDKSRIAARKSVEEHEYFKAKGAVYESGWS